MQESQIKMSWFQRLRQIPSNIAREKLHRLMVQDHEFVREKILNSKSSFHVREAYKTLRTNLIFSLPSDACKKLVVTSALASEGKSTNCLNLAITFAEMDAKVLIVDCDLRRPNLARLLDVQNAPGLSNYLVGLNSLDEVVHQSTYNNLSYITAGNIPPNPVELLGSGNMEKLVEKLEERGIQTRLCMAGNILRQPFYAKMFPEIDPSSFTETEKIFAGGILIGLHQGLSDDDVDWICDQLIDIANELEK